jgi:hypothetical protein
MRVTIVIRSLRPADEMGNSRPALRWLPFQWRIRWSGDA